MENNEFITDFAENQMFLTENEFPFPENAFIPSFGDQMDATTTPAVVDDSQPTTAETTLLTPQPTAEEPMAEVKEEPPEAEEEAVQEEFTVEAIVGKRKRQNRVEYCVKWLGFDATENTWEPIDNLNCKEMIAEFERSGATTATTPARRGRQPKTTPSPKKTTGDGFARGLKPKRVVGVVEEAGLIKYCVEWEGQQETELVASKVARVKIPQLVIAFLQSKLKFNRKRPKEPLENYRPLASKKFSLFSENNRL